MKTLLILLLTTLSIHATDKAYTVTVAETAVPFTNTVQVPKFLPTYGQLTNILISVEYLNSRSVELYSLSSALANYDTATFQQVQLFWPDGGSMSIQTNGESHKGILGVTGAEFKSSATNIGFFNLRVCQDFPPARAPFVGFGVLAFKAGVARTFTYDNASQMVGSYSGKAALSFTILYQYTPGGSGTNFPCH